MTTSSETGTPVVQYLDTRLAYDAWSEVYDSDGNFLQALDTIEMRALLPRMLSLIEAPKPWRIVDLGCGTGRNTLALLSVPNVEVSALDLSAGMLEVARNTLREESQRLKRSSEVRFEVFDMLSAADVPKMAKNANAVVSTLVVEHVPLEAFFSTAAKMLNLGGLFLVTNMHSHMGSISQAGFVDPKTGVKIRPKSYAHTVTDLEVEARKHGFEVVGRIEEKCVDSDLAPKLGGRAAKWVGITVWFGGIFKKCI